MDYFETSSSTVSERRFPVVVCPRRAVAGDLQVVVAALTGGMPLLGIVTDLSHMRCQNVPVLALDREAADIALAIEEEHNLAGTGWKQMWVAFDTGHLDHLGCFVWIYEANHGESTGLGLGVKQHETRLEGTQKGDGWQVAVEEADYGRMAQAEAIQPYSVVAAQYMRVVGVDSSLDQTVEPCP
jgi:hypothetical protein